MSESSMQHYRDQVVAVAVRQNGYTDGLHIGRVCASTAECVYRENTNAIPWRDIIGTFWHDTVRGWRVSIHENYTGDGNSRQIGTASRSAAIEMLMSIGARAR